MLLLSILYLKLHAYRQKYFDMIKVTVQFELGMCNLYDNTLSLKPM
jgi:hypothetical protein